MNNKKTGKRTAQKAQVKSPKMSISIDIPEERDIPMAARLYAANGNLIKQFVDDAPRIPQEVRVRRLLQRVGRWWEIHSVSDEEAAERSQARRIIGGNES